MCKKTSHIIKTRKIEQVHRLTEYRFVTFFNEKKIKIQTSLNDFLSNES